MKVLDPDGSLFENRLIARSDVPELRQMVNFANHQRESKDLQLVLPGYEAMGIAVDDTVQVWRNQDNLIQVPRFAFWDTFWSCHDSLVKRGIQDDLVRRQESE